MSRTAQPRGAAAKTKAAIRREAAADVAKTKNKARPSILDELAAAPPVRPRWAFSAEQRADIDEVFDALAAGTIHIGMGRLAALLKTRYDLPWAVETIRQRLLELHRSRS